jgi:hypothetical protein
MPPRRQSTGNPNNPRSRGWVFTTNNPTAADDESLEQLATIANYVCVGNEVGDGGTPHHQGYVYFQSRKSFMQIKSYLPRSHLEPQRGSSESAVDYCNGKFKEWGTKPCGGTHQTNAWKHVLELATCGQFDKIKQDYPSIYFRYHAKLYNFYEPETPLILDELDNEWWWGNSGTGKSKHLWEMFPNHFKKSLNKWWDGYRFQDVVAIEEWAPKNEVTTSFLKIWADRYPFSGEIKGGTINYIRPKKIIVLSNFSIEQCFTNPEDLGPIRRRFKVRHFITL